MKNLSILGSTGSIGQNTLSIVNQFPDKFTVKVLAAKHNVSLLSEQIVKFSPELAVVYDEKTAIALEKFIPKSSKTEIIYGEKAYLKAASIESVELVIIAVVGASGLLPTLEAIKYKKQIALANKETLVMAGSIVMKEAQKNKVDILPIDSEHSAIFQCLTGQRKKDLLKIIITASGGPFFNKTKHELEKVTVDDALKHPNWDMGKKITVDSATLMNKGLEIIEAMHLFKVNINMIDVIVHPQSIIHSMVAFIDGSVIAQLGIPDMKTAISYAMTFPERLKLNQPIPDFAAISALNFFNPDYNKFLCLKLAIESAKTGGTMPAVLNAANEVAVYEFLNKKISFTDIAKIIDKCMSKHSIITDPSITDILEVDIWARDFSNNLIKNKIEFLCG